MDDASREGCRLQGCCHEPSDFTFMAIRYIVCSGQTGLCTDWLFYISLFNIVRVKYVNGVT